MASSPLEAEMAAFFVCFLFPKRISKVKPRTHNTWVESLTLYIQCYYGLYNVRLQRQTGGQTEFAVSLDFLTIWKMFQAYNWRCMSYSVIMCLWEKVTLSSSTTSRCQLCLKFGTKIAVNYNKTRYIH